VRTEPSIKKIQWRFLAMGPAGAYRLFRGRDAKIEALMRDRGFPITAE